MGLYRKKSFKIKVFGQNEYFFKSFFGLLKSPRSVWGWIKCLFTQNADFFFLIQNYYTKYSSKPRKKIQNENKFHLKNPLLLGER